MPEAGKLWHAALGELQLLMTRANYETWLKNSEGLGFDGEVLRVGVKSPFTQEALATRFAPLVRRTLANVVGHPIDVRYEVASAEPTSRDPLFRADGPLSEAGPIAPARSRRERARQSPAPETRPPGRSPFNPRYTFGTYVVGSSNRLAHAAAEAVAHAPGQGHNPFFIYGDVGLGKTHLLHAIGNAVAGQGLRVLYVSSETFTNDLIDAIRDHRTDDFRQKYRRCHLLLIDDIQFIASKERTQEEFFHTFNAIHGGGGQIVLTSDRTPKAIPTLEDRLRSRFEMGLIADVQPPDLETRIAILASKMSGRGRVPSEVLEFIAHKVQSNIRELEGSLNRVMAYANLHQRELSVELAAQALQDLVAPPRTSHGPESILAAVARYYGVELAELRGRARNQKIVTPRHLAMYLLREDARLSLPQIGALLGGRDHTSVMHACEKVSAEVGRQGAAHNDARAVRELLRS
jgi:chromosomal replication initiator protein